MGTAHMIKRFLIVYFTLVLSVLSCNIPDSTTPPAPTFSPLTPTSEPLLTHPKDEAAVIFTNGIVLTMDSSNPVAEAVAIQANKILAVGQNDEVLNHRGGNTIVIDLDGRMLVPGFIDSHTHRISQRYKWELSTVEEAAQEALSQGWTGLTELAVDESQFNELLEVAEQENLKVRVNVYLTANTFEGDPLPEWYAAYKPGQQFGSYLRVAGLKVFIDGNSGRTLYWEQDELNEFLRQRQAEGWQIAIKAIGIQSHELLISAYESLLQGQGNQAHRHRIEHSLAVNDEQLLRMVQGQIIASIQPSFPGVLWYEPDIHALVNEEGLENIFRWREYQDSGVLMTASPYNPDGFHEELTLPSHVSPMGLLYRSVTQIGIDNSQPEPWMLEKSLSVEEILPLLTINGAYATFEDNLRGSLVVGKLADMVILSENPLQSSPEQLQDIQALMTMVDGKVEYCAVGYEALCP
jgi:predicted amidohydrolase YtcJ